MNNDIVKAELVNPLDWEPPDVDSLGGNPYDSPQTCDYEVGHEERFWKWAGIVLVGIPLALTLWPLVVLCVGVYENNREWKHFGFAILGTDVIDDSQPWPTFWREILGTSMLEVVGLLGVLWYSLLIWMFS